MTDNFSDILGRDIDNLLEEMGGVPTQRVVEEKAKPVAQVQTPVVIKEDNSYIDQLAANISELDDSGFHYHNKQTVDPGVDLTDKWISAIKRDEGLEEINIDPNIDVRLAAMQRQINSVANTVHTFSENTLVSGIGHGPFGQAPGGGATRIVDQDDTLIDSGSLVGGEVLVWDGTHWVPQFVSGVGGDVTSIKEGPGIDVNSSLLNGKGEVTISLDADLNNLNDVVITSPTVSEVVKYDGTKFINEHLRTDELDLANPNPFLDSINRYSRNIIIPPGLNTQQDANQTIAGFIDDLDDRVTDNELDIATIQGNVSSNGSSLAKKPDMTVQATAPSLPSKEGQFWYQPNTKELYVSNNSSGSMSWELASGAGGGGAEVFVQENAPDPNLVAVNEGNLWVQESTKYLFVYTSGSWEQAAYTPYFQIDAEDGLGKGIIRLQTENPSGTVQEVDVVGDGGIQVSVNGTGQIIIDGTNVGGGRTFLGYYLFSAPPVLEPNPNDRDYYEFGEPGIYDGQQVFKGDELYWDEANTAWTVYNKPVPTLDQVLKSDNVSDEEAIVKTINLTDDSFIVNYDPLGVTNKVVTILDDNIDIDGNLVGQKHILSDTDSTPGRS